MAKTLPHKIYVKRCKEATDEWLSASEDFETLADPGEVIEIAVYTKFETIKLDGRARIVK